MSTGPLSEAMTLAAIPDLVDEVIGANETHLLRLATHLHGRGRTDEAIRICEFILDNAPSHLDALLFLVRTWSTGGELENALEKLAWARTTDHAGDPRLTEETWSSIAKAAEQFESCMASGQLHRAEQLCHGIVALYPDQILFRLAQHRMWVQRAAEYDRHVYNSLQNLAATYHHQRDAANELHYRLQIFEHKLDLSGHPALRLNNIQLALSRLLSPEIELFDPERLAVTRRLLDAASAVPVLPVDTDATPTDEAACFTRFHRLLIESIDLDLVFGPAVEQQPPLPITYASAGGVRMSRAEVIARCGELGAEVAFTTATSPEYLQRFGEGYITSILNACDCPCLVFVCLCVPDNRLEELSSLLGINDLRLIYCSDNFDINARPFQMVLPGQPAPSPIPIYYGVAALLRVDHILNDLELPVFSTGIDTVLQKPVRDLLESTSEADIVLNLHRGYTSLGSQIINNLSLIRPTANGRLFIEFLKKYTGERLSKPIQPAFLDQLDMSLAKHHLQKNGISPVIQYFAECDINNLMFNKSTMTQYREFRKQYRFLNIFANGSGDDAMTVADVQS